MQLLNSPPSQSLVSATESLLATLQDITDNIEIENFSIHHPHYKPLEPPAEAIERFQQMSEEVQHKYLSLQLRNFLYGIYYNGSLRTTLAPEAVTQDLPLDLENNTFLGLDLKFYERLHESNRGNGSFDPGWSLVKEESDGSLMVTKGGLKLHIEREKHLQSAEKSANVGDKVAIRLPKNRVQNGFYVAVGNAESNHATSSANAQVLVRVYFNLTPDGAVVVMDRLTQQLNEKAIPFSFKVLYHPDYYERYDSGVLYFDQSEYEAISQVLQTIYAENQSYFRPEIPLFTKQLVPGLGLAEEPDQKFALQESFGMNRCQIVANGLLAAWHQGDNSPESRMKLILEQFSSLGIDLERVHLNAKSKDIYKLWNLDS
ncbi:MAG: T3SS effector HopA1 family protein [Coleofasciculaceae cyanobacterium]